MSNKPTDLEICIRIAEIEGKSYWFNGTGEGICMNYIEGKKASKVLHYNPLTDDALCFRLMVKYKIILSYHSKGYKAATDIFNFLFDKNPNKAICLEIIESRAKPNV
jgi:hypothetical protein